MVLKTRDVPGTAAFFSTALGWRFAVDEDDWRKATKIAANGYQIGSVSDLANPVYPPAAPAHIAYYLAVDDVDRRTEAATAHGARLLLPPFEAGEQGRMATLIDPAGAAFSLWQPYRLNQTRPGTSTGRWPALLSPTPTSSQHASPTLRPLSGNSSSVSTTWKVSLPAYAVTVKASSPGPVRATALLCG
jgi:predicted enzyme related to lactoylglutathione lyase